MTLHYECDRCGACCQGTLIVEAYHIDVLREPQILGADVNGRQSSLDDLTDEDRCILLAAHTPCRFLGNDNCCSIHPTRPNVCVAMPAGDEQCQYARRMRGLPPLQPVQNPEL